MMKSPIKWWNIQPSGKYLIIQIAISFNVLRLRAILNGYNESIAPSMLVAMQLYFPI